MKKMLVKALSNVKDCNGWHVTGEVFETEEDLGDAVETLRVQKEPVKAQEPEQAAETEPEKETEQEPVKPKSQSRRRKVSE